VAGISVLKLCVCKIRFFIFNLRAGLIRLLNEHYFRYYCVAPQK